MNVGDLVTTYDPTNRVGLVEEVWTAGSPRWLVRVRWNNGEVETYFDRQLEVICN